jgi:hypothetical protein
LILLSDIRLTCTPHRSDHGKIYTRKSFVVYSGEERYPVAEGVEAISVRKMVAVQASL